ncbi:MAG: cbb3-type cytochrome c oxidase subunit I [Phycisphaerae bacterium]|nr:cbb3-type cytochrome c oxidase subunit I [Tepidisphaeraceae bacterium]
MNATAPAHHDDHAHHDPGFLKKYVFSTDHKVIGIQFLFMGLMFCVIGGGLAMLIRWQLAWPGDMQNDRPVPLLGYALWSKPANDRVIGLTIEHDAAKKSITLANAQGLKKLSAGDAFHLRTDAGVVYPSKVIALDKQRVTLDVSAAPADLKFEVGKEVKRAIELGKVASVDAAGFTVEGLGGHDVVAPRGDATGDTVIVKPVANNAVTPVDDAKSAKATVTGFEKGRATFALAPGAPAAPKVGDLVIGKRVPGPMPADFFNMVFTMHATIMIFFVVIPLLVGTFGNYLIPLKIGAADMAFPFLNGLAFWSAIPSGAIMVAGFFMPGGHAQAGWTSYPPVSTVSQNPKPWNTGSWYAWKQPVTATEHAADVLRIGGHVVDLAVTADGKNVVLTVPALTDPALAKRASNAANAALSEFKEKRTDLKLAEATSTFAPATADKPATITLAGADEAALRAVAADTQSKLRWRSNWSDVAIISTYLAFFLMAGFMAAHYVRLGHPVVNFLVGLPIAATAGFFLNKFAQYAAFDGQSAWFLSIIILGFSSLMGAVNYLTTIIKLRCPGMTMFRLPLSVWSLFITSLLVLLATPVLASALTLNLLDHHGLTSFFVPMNWTRSNAIQTVAFMGGSTTISGGGYPLLHQHLFWFYSHPAVYIMILPAMGMVSDILAVFARKPIFGYRPMVYAMGGIAFLGFIVWAHHMFQSGMNPTLGTTFAVSTMFIAVPSAIKVFNWLGTLWRGNIQFTSAMCNALAFVSMFVIGGLSGIFMASTAVDVHIHDTYFIVAHIHYVLFGGSLFGIFAGIYFWYPKMFGRVMNEFWGRVHFVLTFVSFNCTFFAMHILGLAGYPRRVPTGNKYQLYAQFQDMNWFISISAFVLGISQLPFIINFLGGLIWGKKASQNPWNATTLEWVDAPTPPPHNNFLVTPVVHHGPYEYSSPLVEEDFLAQTRPLDLPAEVVASAQKH